MGALKPDVLKCPHTLICLGLKGKKRVFGKLLLSQKRNYYEIVLTVDKERKGCQESKSTYLIQIKSPYCFLRLKKMFIFRIISGVF